MHRLHAIRPSAAIAALSLLVTLAVTASPLSAAQAATTTVSSVDFEDGTTGTWTQSGGDGSTLAVIDDDTKVASIARTADYVGLESPTGIFEPDTTYTLSMRMRLAEGTPGTTSARFVMKPNYTWIGNTSGVSADAWTTVTGQFTVPAGADPATLSAYLGTGDLSGGETAYTYLVDDILVTTTEDTGDGIVVPPGFVGGGAINPTTTPVAAAQGLGDVAALTFDDGPNGQDTSDLLDFLDAQDIDAVFCVIGQNIEAPGGAAMLQRIVAEGHTLCNHSTGYADMGGWSEQQVADDLIENLDIIRTALGDPTAAVPFFRAPNGSWGATPGVAVELGMQPLAVVNTISDWETQDVPTLEANLRAAIAPGEIVLAHDGGGDRSGTVAAVQSVVAEYLADGWEFTLPVGTPPASNTVVLSTGFEDGLDGWIAREVEAGSHSVATTTDDAHEGVQSAAVTARTSQGSGIGFPITDELTAGVTYDVTAWVRFGEGQTTDDIVLSLARTTDGTTSYDNLLTFTGVSNSGWTEVSGSFTPSSFDTALLYFETAYDGGATGNTSDFYVDDIEVRTAAPALIQDLTPIKDTVPFPMGVAIDSRETVGASAELTLRHFGQITAENYMKPEAWYNAAGEWSPNASEIGAVMDFARDNGLDVYGHVLVWHSQTPAFFFQHEDGTPLSTSEEDKQILRDRMREHIFNVAEYLSTGWGEFGGDNPVTAFDVVNEVIDDSAAYADGMRRSEWYRILGEEFVDLAFQYADEAFNETYADASADRPVTLFINDYNTEQAGKRGRYLALIDRLLDRGAPVDGIGHQFHVSLAMPVENLEQAIVDASELGLIQAVTEFDVTTGVPESQAKFIDQGYYFRDAFDVFRAYASEMFSVTVWGLIDSRSWRDSSGGPLVFDDALQAKYAYYGIVEPDGSEEPLPPRSRTANVFAGAVALDDSATSSPEWDRLPLHSLGSAGAFQLRWSEDALTAYVTVDDAVAEAADGVEIEIGSATYAVGRDGTGDAPAVVTERGDGYDIVVEAPLDGAAINDTLQADVRVVDGSEVSGWNTPGALGTLTLVEELSFASIPEAGDAPVIDGERDAAWDGAAVLTTDKEVSGTGGAIGTFHTLWRDQTLYLYAEIADPVVDVTGSDPWIQDSVEIYLDAGNAKNGAYRYDDTQIRINAENVVSFGTGDETFQANRVDSATSIVDGGYVVEVAISLLEYGGEGTFHGLDVQVNDAAAGARQAIRNWADPTGAGYQSTARWGVAELVSAGMPFSDVDESLEHYEAIQWMWENGLTTGFSDGTFRPYAPIGRDAIAAFLYRLEAPEGYEAPTTPVFSDVTPTSTEFYTEISWMGESGISQGFSDGTYRPLSRTSRDAMAAFLYRLAEVDGYEAPAAPLFSDVTASGSEFYTEISWLAEAGISTGWSDGTFRPLRPVTRDAFAAFLYRYMEGGDS